MVERCRGALPIAMMCRLLKVSRSGFHDWRDREPSVSAKDNARLLRRITALHEARGGILGSPRITEDLHYQGNTCSKNRVARLMRSASLKGVPMKGRPKSPPSEPRPDGVSNELAQDFAADEARTKWVTDITYVRTGEGWLYLCVVIDLFSKQVVGWSTSAIQDRQLVIQAVLMALWQRNGNAHVILRSDRGCQFTSDEYRRFLSGYNITCSISGVGTCADNAAA